MVGNETVEIEEYTVDALVDVEAARLTSLLEMSESVAVVFADGACDTEGGLRVRSSVE